ncbi:MAG: binding-protein-dependent transport system inner rane component, partial [Clostridiales bacterium]|nr:binding-protein-dependent transport system inner rane component [Clostridiales bacterium]
QLGLSLILIISTLTGCQSLTSSAEAPVINNDENVLNVFNWSEYLPESLIKEFEEKYKIKVNYLTYSSNEEMLAKIMAGDDIFDISVASDYMVEVMRKQKLMEEINMSNVPNFKNIGDEFKNLSFDPGNKYSVPYMWGTGVIAVNISKVSGVNITSYGDLWDSKFKNSLVVLDDERAIIGIALKKLGYSINETDPAKLEQARAELLKLKPNIKSFNSDSPKAELLSGGVTAGYMWGAEAARAGNENKAIKTFFPKEGMYIWQDNFVIPKGALHKENAELFINFLLDPKVSAEISKEFPYANPNLAAHQYIEKGILNNPAVYPTESELKIGERLEDIGDATKLYDKIWVEFRGK